ncbi:hypothetical protein V6767_07285 [Martelella sp. FLE1502]
MREPSKSAFSAIRGGKADFDELKREVEQLKLAGSGSGGGSDMEGRVAKLEANVENIDRSLTETRKDARDIRDRVIRIEEKINHLASKGFIVTAVISAMALLGAWITFQDKIQNLLSLN